MMTGEQRTERRKTTPMTSREAIFYLQALLDDTLDAHDDSDAKRIEAVELAIGVLEEKIKGRKSERRSWMNSSEPS